MKSVFLSQSEQESHRCAHHVREEKKLVKNMFEEILALKNNNPKNRKKKKSELEAALCIR